MVNGIIQQGYEGCVRAAYGEGALAPDQAVETRRMFFAGAAYLLEAMMALMDPGEDATDGDMARMTQIKAELDAFGQELDREVFGKPGSLKPACGRTGCDRDPTHYLRMLIPPTGGGIDRAIKAIIAIGLCRDHANEAKPADFMNDDMTKDRVRQMVGGISTVTPDFDRTQLEVRRLGDKPWNEYQSFMAQQQGGGRA